MSAAVTTHAAESASGHAQATSLANIGGAAASANALGIQSFYQSKIRSYEILINQKTQNLRRLEAQRNALNARVRLLREELQLLQEPGSYVGEVVKVMGKKKVLVKVQPEGKYGQCCQADDAQTKLTHSLTRALLTMNLLVHTSRRLCIINRRRFTDTQLASRSAIRLV